MALQTTGRETRVMMTIYARRVADYGTTIFSEVNALISGRNVMNLGQGRPNFDGPDVMLQAAADAMLTHTANQYPPGYGIAALREALADHAATYYDMSVNPENGVLITGGATEGVFSAILGLVDAGDEVILLEPFYDTYLRGVQMAGAIPVYVPMQPPTWSFDPGALKAAFNSRTRAIVLNTPHNPSGRVFSRDELNLIAALCQQHDVLVISDEVYEHLTYADASHTPIAVLPGMQERTVTVSSAAKTFSVTGWKVGWAMGPPELIEGVWRVHQNVIFAINHPGQYGVLKGLELGATYFEELQAMYARKREILLQGLDAAGLRVTYTPNGAFYVLADFSGVFEGDDRAFTRHLIDTVGVACIPPSPFFSDMHMHLGRNHVRFAYCQEDETLHQAAERLAKLR
jgi:N-succinyldiaminopimelate aminotransferase